MPYRKINAKEEINKQLEKDPELKVAYELAQEEYEKMKKLILKNKGEG